MTMQSTLHAEQMAEGADDYPAAKSDRRTNESLMIDMMNFSKAGALKQAFIIDAVLKQSKLTLAYDGEGWPENYISLAAWKTCAAECIEAIENRGTR